jgi:hypothetical protein
VVINNEDYQQLSFSRGMYIDGLTNIPDGYSPLIKNMVVDNGTLTARGAIQVKTPSPAIGYGYTETASSTEEYKHTLYRIGLTTFTPSEEIADAGFVGNAGTNPRPPLVFIYGSGPYSCVPPAAILLGPLCVYNTTLYAAATTGVFKLGVNNFPTVIVETAVAGSPTNLIGLVSHKSRLFGWNDTVKNRLYFTDAPAVGALPDTWNIGTNFIDFNGPRGDTDIQQVVPLGNYLYVFTNNGLFSLYLSGAPTNWIVKMINPTIINKSPRQVVSFNSLIYYVTNKGVYVTDGFEFKLLSAALDPIFNGAGQRSTFNLFIVDNGLLLVSKDTAIPAAYKMYYSKFTTISWSQFSLATSGTVDLTGFRILGTLDTVSPAKLHPHTSIVAYFSTNSRINVYFYATNIIGPDMYPTYTGAVYNGDVSLNIFAALETRLLIEPNFMRTKHYKQLFMYINSSLDKYDFNATVEYQGAAAPNLTELAAPTITPVSASTALYRFGMDQKAFSAKVRWIFELLTTVGGIDMQRFNIGPVGLIAMLDSTAPLKGVNST